LPICFKAIISKSKIKTIFLINTQKKGTASITKINDSTIGWKIITKPKVEYYLPDQMVLRRR
jgi:hypothetical protein